jgi:hypothetical protein
MFTFIQKCVSFLLLVVYNLSTTNALFILPQTINSNTKYMYFGSGFLHLPSFYEPKLFKALTEKNTIIDAPSIPLFNLNYDNDIDKLYDGYKNVQNNLAKYNIEPSNLILAGHSKGGLDMCNMILKYNIPNPNLMLIEPVDMSDLKLQKFIKKYSSNGYLNVNKAFIVKFDTDCWIDCTPNDRSNFYFSKFIRSEKLNYVVNNTIKNLCHEDIQESIYSSLCLCNILEKLTKYTKNAKSTKNLKLLTCNKELIIKQMINDAYNIFEYN